MLSDDFEWKHKRIDNSRPPLRWIANLAGSLASSALLRISWAEENEDIGFRYNIDKFIWDRFWPIYEKYGTFYKIQMDVEDEWE
jgi:hypothetical protein